jgi:hypothetical protein
MVWYLVKHRDNFTFTFTFPSETIRQGWVLSVGSVHMKASVSVET